MPSMKTPPLSVPSTRESPKGPSAVDVIPLCNVTGQSEACDSLLGVHAVHHWCQCSIDTHNCCSRPQCHSLCGKQQA